MKNPYAQFSNMDNGERDTCPKDGGLVSADDCEDCVGNRTCYQWCLEHIVFGAIGKPLWVHERYKYGENLGELLKPTLETVPPTGHSLLQQATPTIPLSLRWEVWERDNFTCKNCGLRRNLTIDHIIPVSKGGETKKDNLQTLCKHCNSAKGTKSWPESDKSTPVSGLASNL